MVNHVFPDWVVVLVASIGITYPAHHWMGGMLLAIAGASVAFKHDPERNTREVISTYITACVIAHIASIIVYWWLPDFMPQITMFITGMMSRRIVRFVFRLADNIESRSNTIAGRLINKILPLPDATPEPSSEDRL